MQSIVPPPLEPQPTRKQAPRLKGVFVGLGLALLVFVLGLLAADRHRRAAEQVRAAEEARAVEAYNAAAEAKWQKWAEEEARGKEARGANEPRRTDDSARPQESPPQESPPEEQQRADRLKAGREDAKLLKKMADGLGMSAVVLETDVEELSPWVGMVSVPEAWWERMTPVEQKSFTRGVRRVWGKLHGPAAGGQEKCRLKIYASFPGGVREVARTRILDPESVELSD